MITEEMYQELVLKIQALEDKLDKYISSNGHSGVYTDDAPAYVKDYIKERKLRGEKE